MTEYTHAQLTSLLICAHAPTNNPYSYWLITPLLIFICTDTETLPPLLETYSIGVVKLLFTFYTEIDAHRHCLLNRIHIVFPYHY